MRVTNEEPPRPLPKKGGESYLAALRRGVGDVHFS